MTYKRGDKLPMVGWIQRALKADGFYTALVDNDYGPRTEDAVRAFQRDRGLLETGIADRETIQALDREHIGVSTDLLTDMGVTLANANKYRECLDILTKQFEIDTPFRLGHFLAQTCHESLMLTRTVENMRYTSAERIREVWRSRFPTVASARPYVRQPRKLANFVYGDRMGNRGQDTDDGWNYRGHGLIHLTGRDNHLRFFRWMALPEDTDPATVGTIYAVPSAIWFWTENGLNRFADRDDIEDLTRRINGGLHGIDQRRALYMRAIRHLTASAA